MLFPSHVFHLGNANTEITFETLSGNLMARKQGKSERKMHQTLRHDH